MRVLITGSNGQLGRELVTAFSSHDVVSTDRQTLDLGSPESIYSAIQAAKPQVIIASGAYTAVDDAQTDVTTAMRINGDATADIVSAASKVGARVLYVSTDYVFDGTLDREYVESDTTNPQTVYGKSKLAGEQHMRDVDTIVRTSWVFGRYGNNIVKTLLKLAESTPALKFVDDQRGKPTCAEDLAVAIRDLVEDEVTGTLHVTNSGETTWFDFARDVFRAAGHDPDRISPVATKDQVPQRPAPRPANSSLDNAALRAAGRAELDDHREAMARVLKQLQ